MVEELENNLDNYFGSLNEIRLGITTKPAEKPYELILYEQCSELQIPLVDGGIMDQPHIWMLQYAVCKNRKQMWRDILERATNPGRQS